MAKKKRDSKRVRGASEPSGAEVIEYDDPGMPYEGSSESARPPGGTGYTEAQTTAVLIAAIMDAPIDPDLGVDPEYVADLREEVAEMHARGTMVDIPWSCDDFDPDEFRDHQ
jgi:hypothetical protein